MLTHSRHDAGDGAYEINTGAATSQGELVFSVTASYSAGDVMTTLFDFSGVQFHINPSALDVGSGAAGVVSVRNFASFENHHASSADCSIGTYITSSNPDFASWPADTEATLTFSVAADGTVSAPTIGGLPFEPVPFAHDPSWSPSCQPVVLGGDAPMVLGKGRSDKFAPFKGVIAALSVEAPAEEPLPPVASPPPPASTVVCARGGEWGNTDLWCPEGTVVRSIDFASFGTAYGQCGDWMYSGCNSGNSYDHVANACMGQSGCSIYVSNGDFGGDPCPYVQKTLTFQATCSV